MKYKIKPGHSFLDSDGKTKTGGDTIDLSDDVAEQHKDKVDPVTEDTAADTGAAAAATDDPVHFAGE